MGRRKTLDVNEVNETLSQEAPEVQEELLEEMIKPEDNQDNEVEPGEEQKEEMNNLSIEEEKVEDFKPGDRVKLHNDIKFDLLGRRIHNGIRNYHYRVLSVRIDGMLVIECLTHCFTVKPTDVDKL